MERVKRTYNLSPRTVATVRELAAEHVAATQDAVVELAVEGLARQVAAREEAALWEAAAADPEFQAERREIEREFRGPDAEVWPE
jgi:hypothetical protein